MVAVDRGPGEGYRGFSRFDHNRIVTLVFIAALIATLVAGSARPDLDVGVLRFSFGAALAFIDPAVGRADVMKIDWALATAGAGPAQLAGARVELRGL